MWATEYLRAQDSSTVALSCCPKQSCPVVVARIGANFCERCGSELQLISYELWLDKFVKPALRKNPAELILDPARVFRVAAEMGLFGREARKRLDDLVAERTGANANVLDNWIRETADLLEDDQQWESAQRKALSKAKKLKINFLYAAAVVTALAQKIQSASGKPVQKFVIAESSLRNPFATLNQSQAATQRPSVAAPSPNRDVDSLKDSALSFYRNFATGGEVSDAVTYLKAERARPGALGEQIFLREIPSALGTYVLFRSDKEGWVFPNPRLPFRPEAFKILFPALTRHQFDSSKQGIDPVRVVPAGRGRWQLSLPRNGAKAEELANLGRQEGDKPKRPVLVFPLSAAECEEKLHGFAKVVRHDGFRQMLVDGPGGKGEFAVTTETGLANSCNDLFVVPRITTFQSESTYANLYAGYYEGGTRQLGEVWIVKPAIVDKVSGGWRLREKGVLQVGKKPKRDGFPSRPDSVERPRSSDVVSDRSKPTKVTNRVSEKTKYWLAGSVLIAVGVVFLMLLIWPASRTPNEPIKDKTMVEVSGGTFLMGSNDGEENERPQHSVAVKSFSIDIYEVTREEYEKFIKTTNHRVPSGWANGHYPANTARWPVTGVDWYDADAYCKWMGKRLPSEEEWELAARGTDGRKYPWGKDWNAGFANAENASQALTDVDRFKGASPFGAIGMTGNAWEWTASKLAHYPGGRIPPGELGNTQVDLRVIRGGSWQSKRTSATTTYRWGWPASGGSDYANTGFRCVKDP